MSLIAAHHFAMAIAEFLPGDRRPRVVGSFGNLSEIKMAAVETVRESCDIAEIRLDLLGPHDTDKGSAPWGHLAGVPLLFTARREDEGGARFLSPADRTELLRDVMDQAACVDVEVASIREMEEILAKLEARRIPWIASYHDFDKLPPTADLECAVGLARNAGAAVFKAAARLATPADLARLAEFQLADHGIPVATMGMGPLAPVSRLLCAQCGSVLNYGYLGNTATAPGQWDSGMLKTAISKLPSFLFQRAT